MVAQMMNNEPVAWIANDADLPLKEDGSYWLYPKNPSEENLYIPLYTHPVNPKYDPEPGEPLIDGYPLFSGLPHPVKEQLTDEDLEVITEALLMVGFTDAFINYELKEKALAILRKAQEK
jgi:hypothetical protein